MNGLIGRKLGMTQVFTETGEQVPVTVLAAGPCPVVQRKTAEKDGYDAVQLGFEAQKEHRLTLAQIGHFKRAGVAPQKVLCELTVEPGSELAEGDAVTVEALQSSGFVDVTAISKGRGFQGVMRRHNMKGQRATHGSGTHRAPGSIGQCEFPARVFKGKKLPGQMGNARVTTQNLKVVQVRPEEGLLLLRGAVPGPTGGVVVIRESLKKTMKVAS